MSGEKRANRKKKWPLIICALGVVALITGAAFLIFKLATGPSTNDAEYLVSVGEWMREDASDVVWNFTEIGKGTLTNDAHLNDYNFEWAIDGDKLQIKTAWLYDLNDEFEYHLDQNTKTLIIRNEDKDLEIKFVAND